MRFPPDLFCVPYAQLSCFKILSCFYLAVWYHTKKNCLKIASLLEKLKLVISYLY